MDYSIGEVSKMFNITVSTIRFYDKEGLLLDIKRDSSGIRRFDEKTIEALRLIECLKKSGMQIKDIKEFMKWCSLGNETLETRKEMFIKQKKAVEAQIKDLEKTLSMIKFKCWYYDTATKDGSDERVKNMTLDEMPEDIRIAYIDSHE